MAVSSIDPKNGHYLRDVFMLGTPDGVELHRRGSKQYSLRLDYGKWQYTAIPSKSDQAESGGSVFNYKYDWTDDGFISQWKFLKSLRTGL